MKTTLLALAMLIAGGSLAFAQEHRVSGKVTGGDGSSLPGITVQVKGTNTGTATNAEGEYELSVPDNATLIFRGIGFEEQEVAVGSETVVNVTLQSGLKSLNEVVVVGYSTTTKQAFTGTVKTVSADRIENKDVTDVSHALAGEVPGVRVINSSGQPGSTAIIRIRGFGSVNGNRNPLYVVDGVPFSSVNSFGTDNTAIDGEEINPLNSINPDDIESINVLTDAVATAIYGARGSNGVVLITTKSGKGKKPYVEVSTKYGVNKSIIPRYDVIQSPEVYIGLSWQALYNEGKYIADESDPAAYANKYLFSGRGISPYYNMWKVNDVSELIDPKTGRVKPGVERKYTPENWGDYAFQPSERVETNLKMGGGDDKTSYYSSIGYLNDKGYSIKSNFKRITARLNLQHQVNSWLSGKMNFAYANSTTNNNGQESNSNSVFWFVDNMPPIFPVFLRDGSGNKVPDPIFGGYQYDYGDNGRGFGSLTNSIADAHYNTNRSKRNDFNGNGSLTAKFLKHFSFKSQFGLQYYNNDYVNLINKFYGSAASQHGSIQQDKTELVTYDWLNMLSYNQSFGENNIEVLAAHEANSWKTHYLSTFKYNLVENDNTELNNAVVSQPATSYTLGYEMESWFAQVNYDYNSTYYFSGSIRRDGSSRFLKHKWGNFGSLGLGWVVTNESFLQNTGVLKYLKLKASYGLIGDQAGVGYYPGYDLYEINNVNDNPAFSFNTKGNPDLTWETSKIFQVGTEFKLGAFLTGSVDYYVKNTDNLIFNKRYGPSIGYAYIKVNDGRLRNQGLEFELTGHLVQQRDFHVDLGINGEILRNKITQMPYDPSVNRRKAIDPERYYGWSKGHSIYDFYMPEYLGVDPDKGVSIWRMFYHDDNGNGKPDAGEGIRSLADYKSKNPDKINEIQATTTEVYGGDTMFATEFYVGKSAIPKVRGAVNLTAGYKGLSLAVQLLYSFGGYGYDFVYSRLMDDVPVGNNNWSTDILKAWKQKGDMTDVPRITNGNDPNVRSTSSRFLTKADYLNLNNVNLSYKFPEHWLTRYGITDLTVWVSGDNLWLHSARTGYDPAITENGESDWYTYAPLSTFSAGIKIRF